MIGPLPPPRGGVATFLESMRRELPASGYDVEIFRTGQHGDSPSAAKQVAFDLRCVLRFVSTSRRFQADIVHVHTSSYYSFLRNVPYLLWTRRFSGARQLAHVHGGMFREFYDHAPRPVRWLVRGTLRAADVVIVTSPSWIEIIRDIVGPGPEIVPLPNGFDSGTFRPMERVAARAKLGLPVEGRMLVTVGYLESIKGHVHLIDALALMNRDDVRLYIIGDGSLRDELAKQVSERGLDGRVIFVHEARPPEEIAKWIGASDAFVLPSLGEGNPTVMFEALGSGRPFVGTRVGGIPDVIVSDDLGVLCDPGDPQGLADALAAVLGREWDAGAISGHAQRYSWTNIAARLSRVYDQLLSR
ncbi:MAG: glycosyltransferase family 4 protein [Methanomassiliicoccus sp.]|nr:glycosyltransferase family 4 protein [Methanomassiliicoccus sp.]